ncbi:hypothetical protein FC300_07045 [Escherichia coli]|uniref:hypothetical protein n=1 Tax=Escherichia coli TaxID=562 RepID=UPI000984275D|nr:hypothetical protein [Escherichia coli]EFC4553787.1 hypothetical protein [Escherichia coli]EFD0956957.1 hypothetical protein [Escherichia coli]EFK6333335.1 hypothetical protein [Escherichia coli]EHH4023318.1 hypothetical protein [Escherichia coli]EHX8377844.1 hypothetical protein [Escherichia coli]
MKQMTLIEMDGFLKGKCIPRDLKVNETNAEYLVRKFAEAEAKISALSEDHQKAIESIKQADSAVKLAHEKFSALAAENAGLKSFGDKLNEMHNDLNGEGTGIQGRAEVACQQVALEAAMEEFDAIKTPATDAFLDEVRAEARNEGINYTASRLAAAFNHGFINKSLREVFDVTRMILSAKEELANEPHPIDGLSGEYAEKSLEEWAEQIRKGGNQ